VSRFASLAVGIFVIFGAQALFAQGGHGGPPKPSTDTSIQDFKRAMAVQAAPDQVSDFKMLAKNVDDAIKQAHDLQQQASAATDATGLYKPGTTLKDTIDQIQNDSQAFVKAFTRAQTEFLKDHTKKLAKAQSELTKENKNLDEQARRSLIDPKQLADAAGRVEKALTDVQSQQLSLGDEMGIPKV
jgi:hypothetical protein